MSKFNNIEKLTPRVNKAGDNLAIVGKAAAEVVAELRFQLGALATLPAAVYEIFQKENIRSKPRKKRHCSKRLWPSTVQLYRN